MINNTQDILFGETQTLVYDVMQGRPSGITGVEIRENSDGDDVDAVSDVIGAPALETSPNTTFSAASGQGQTDPRRLTLTSITGITPGRAYLATDAEGRSEWVEIMGCAGTAAYARHPLKNSYVATDTFVSTRVAATFAAAWLADTSNLSYWLDPNPRWRARVEVTVSSVKYVAYTYFDVVRWNAQTSVTGNDVDAAFPGFLDSLSPWDREDAGARIVREAMRMVKLDLYGELKADQQMRNAEVFDDLILHRALVLSEMAKQVQGNGNAEAVASAQSLYNDRFTSLIRAKTVPAMAVDDGGAGVDVMPLGISRR